MKNKIFIILILVLPFVSSAQTTIKTPTNVSVEALLFNEWSPAQLQQIEADAANWITQNNSQAVRVAPASGRYNCHNWAWHQSHGGGINWINKNDQFNAANVSKYWSGAAPTYNLTNADITYATAANYPNGDHSARVTAQVVNGQRIYESKWGNWPRYTHRKTDCPYTSNLVNHYKVPVTGKLVNCISSSSSYSTVSISGASYTWSASGASVSGSSAAVTATATTSGSGSINVSIASPYSGTTVTGTRALWGGPFDTFVVGVTGPVGACMGNNAVYQPVMPEGHVSGYTYSWVTTTNWWWNTSNTAQSPSLYVPLSGATGGTMRVSINNGCGFSGLSGITVYPMPCGYSSSTTTVPSAYPNPNPSGDFNIQFEKAGDYELALTDFSGAVRKKQTVSISQPDVVRFNASGLERGTYILNINNGRENITTRLVVE